MILMGTIIMALGLFLLPILGELQIFALLLVLACALSFGKGITLPCISSLLSQWVGDDEQGLALGYGQSLSALGRVIGLSFAGVLFEFGRGVPFYVGSGLLLIGVAVSLIVNLTFADEKNSKKQGVSSVLDQ